MVIRLLRSIATTALLTVLSGFTPAPRAVHPLHTSLTEVSHVAATGLLTVRIRVFAQDIDSVIARPARKSMPADATIMNYVIRRVALNDEHGRALRLVSCGVRRESEALFACIHTTSAVAPRSLTMRNELLFDLFDDQINVVQVISGSSRRSLLFTRTSASRRLQ